MRVSTQSPEDELTTLGRRLRAVREWRGMKLGATARQLGISRTSLGGWESDSVKNPDLEKLVSFSKLADVDLKWLLQRDGPDPVLAPPRAGGKSPLIAAAPWAGAPAPARAATEVGIPEVSPAMAAHATAIDLTARAYWSIPTDVLELGFQATPGKLVVKREMLRDAEAGLKRGDYVLIDISRTMIDEPGIWLLADPDGKAALRAHVIEDEDKRLIVAELINSPATTVSLTDAKVLGRVMGIFSPV